MTLAPFAPRFCMVPIRYPRLMSEEGAVSEEQVFVDASEDVATPSKPAVAPSEADPLAHYKALALEYFNTAQELANKYAGQAQDVAKEYIAKAQELVAGKKDELWVAQLFVLQSQLQ
ncbi:hypothetical protein MNEG_9887 [Monoraphidium neglectum]|uniref:Uncharacterized protein n=1 Tax=Monoraphidium neglectum TaxID=145388 RepID=A0A0D2MB09_9CHLO|nr:hypothetical protein MNEG_9887 [Monoraphidium neglectum]KIY98076.1 hypothetical protein MNEG_9887 [Monoraphidium neglectum]|eukprot:XP_013897096.1 hypothetical protein MNEG_9887 [Monoraphidium neglectum]